MLVSISLIGVVSCGSDSKDETQNEDENVKAVKVIELSKKTITRGIDYSATLTANEELYLASATPGRIISISVEVGDRVYPGQVLVQMDPTQLNTANMQLLSLEKDFERFDTLIQYGGVSQQQYDQMKTQVEVTRANVSMLSTNTTLVAPFSGIITAKYFENGELFSGAPNTQAGKAAIVVLQQINPIKATISLSQKYFPIIKNGMNVHIVSEIYPDTVFNGKVNLIHPTINAGTKTFNVEISINNYKELLRPGMFAKVNLELTEDAAMLVPVISVLQQMGTNDRYVYIYNDGIAKKVDVEIGERFDDQIEILSAELKVGDQLIIAGHNHLDDGQKLSLYVEEETKKEK
jgi:RND family efflux transporter MFP subunit